MCTISLAILCCLLLILDFRSRQDEAGKINRSFHESVRFPAQRKPVRVRIFQRDERNLFSVVWSVEVDAGAPEVIRKQGPARRCRRRDRRHNTRQLRAANRPESEMSALFWLDLTRCSRQRHSAARPVRSKAPTTRPAASSGRRCSAPCSIEVRFCVRYARTRSPRSSASGPRAGPTISRESSGWMMTRTLPKRTSSSLGPTTLSRTARRLGRTPKQLPTRSKAPASK